MARLSKAQRRAAKKAYNHAYYFKRKDQERQSTMTAEAPAAMISPDLSPIGTDRKTNSAKKKTSQASKVKANGNQRLSSSAMSGGTSSGGIKASIAKNGKATKNKSKEIIALQRLSGGKARIVVIVIPG